MNIIIFIITFTSLNCFAKPIVIGTESLSKSEVQARINALNGVPYSDFILDKLKEHVSSKNLYDKATQLRKAELNKDYNVIYEICQNIAQIKHQRDWNKADRFLIHRCFQHLAKLSTDKRTQIAFQQEAAAFSEKKLTQKELNSDLVQNYKWVLINGKSFPTSEGFIEVPNVAYRMTLISDRYQSFTKIMEPEQLKRLQFKPSPLISGSCSSGFRYDSRHLSELDIENTMAVDNDCKMKLSSHHPIERNLKVKRPDAINIPNWALWLAGGLVGYAIYENNQNRNQKPAPTTKRGF